MIKRAFEIIFSLIALILSLPLLVFFGLQVFFEDFRSPIFTQERVGKNKKIFKIYKLRTMKIDTPDIETHKTNRDQFLKSSRIIRKLKIDELPQFFNVLVGEMSIVGPRPCLSKQNDLIKEREKWHIFDHKPGITGISQLKNVMMDQIELQAQIDSIYNDFFGGEKNILENIFLYFYCIANTAIKIDAKLIYLDELIKQRNLS